MVYPVYFTHFTYYTPHSYQLMCSSCVSLTSDVPNAVEDSSIEVTNTTLDTISPSSGHHLTTTLTVSLTTEWFYMEVGDLLMCSFPLSPYGHTGVLAAFFYIPDQNISSKQCWLGW